MVHGSYLSVVPGHDLFLCVITVLVATFSTWPTAAVVRLQQCCRVKFTYLHYRRYWKCSPSSWIHLPHLLNIFWMTHY